MLSLRGMMGREHIRATLHLANYICHSALTISMVKLDVTRNLKGT